MAVDLAVSVAALLLWVIVLSKFRGSVVARSGSAHWLLATFFCLALGATLFVRSLGTWLEAAAGLQLQEPLARSSVLVAAFCAQVLLAQLSHVDDRREKVVSGTLLAGALSVVWWTFALGPSPSTARFGSQAQMSGRMTLFISAFLVYLAYAVTRLLVGCVRYSRSAPLVMRRGLRLMAAGCVSGLGYVAVKLSAVTLRHLDAPMTYAVESSIGRLLAVLAGVLVAVGASLPTLAVGWRQLNEWYTDYQAHRRLYPLWKAMTTAVPEIALDPPSGRVVDALRVRQVHLRLYRRIIELRDVWLHLRLMQDDGSSAPPSTLQATPNTPDRALHAVRVVLSGQDPEMRDVEVGAAMQDEVAWWLTVASAFADSLDGQQAASSESAAVT